MGNTCLRCGSDKIITELPLSVEVTTNFVEAYGTDSKKGKGRVDIHLNGNPTAMINKNPISGRLVVRVCGECGHADLYATNFSLLYKAYENSHGKNITEIDSWLDKK